MGSHLEKFSVVDRIVIEHAVEDYAAQYYGQRGSLWFGESSAVRYVTEGHLRDLTARHGTHDVWEAVAEVVAQRPAVLTYTEAERDARRQARQDAVARVSQAAAAACKAGRYVESSALIDAVELIDPAYRDERGRGVAEFRGAVARLSGQSE